MSALVDTMPFAAGLGLAVDAAAPEEVRGGLDFRPELCTAGGVLHGGALMAAADSLGAICAFLNLPAGASTATMESKTNFFRAVRGGRVHARLAAAPRRALLDRRADRVLRRRRPPRRVRDPDPGRRHPRAGTTMTLSRAAALPSHPHPVLIAGNWKMFKGPEEAGEFCRALREARAAGRRRRGRLPAVRLARRGGAGARRHRDRRLRAELPLGARGRVHGRGVGADAARARASTGRSSATPSGGSSSATPTRPSPAAPPPRSTRACT